MVDTSYIRQCVEQGFKTEKTTVNKRGKMNP